MSRKAWLVLLGVPLLGLGAYMAIRLGRTVLEQLAWYPRDDAALEVLNTTFAREGILLTVRAPSRVDQVWCQDPGPLPWQAHHRRTSFSSLPAAGGGETLLVPYDFSPGAEWLLALRSGDGHWVSMSPYFPKQPAVSTAAWRTLLAAAEQRPVVD